MPSDQKIFPIAPMGPTNRVLVWGILLLPALLILTVVGDWLGRPPDAPGRLAPAVIIGGVVIVMATVFGAMTWAGRLAGSTKFEVAPDGLHVRSFLYGRTFPRQSLKLDEARIVEDLDRARFVPVISAGRMIGINLPGGCLGTYLLKDRSIALFYVSYPFSGPIVCIPTIGPYPLVLSPADPVGFLDEMRKRNVSR